MMERNKGSTSSFKYRSISHMVFFILYFGNEMRAATTISTTHILNTYALVCGFDYLCDPTSVSFINQSKPIIPVGNIHLTICPRCKCDSQCEVRRDCCPDILFDKSELSCENFAVIGEEKRFLVVTSCPGSPDNLETINFCSRNYTNEEKFTYVPVSLKNKTTVYRNDDCAKCHGEKETEEWQLRILCNGVVDLNHLSSYDEIFKVADENACSMEYVPPVGRSPHVCFEKKYHPGAITECNMTGQWHNYDQDIEWACDVYNVPYRMYKNVFCYICNPEIASVNQRLIDSCNTTGMWTPFDENLEYACLRYPQSDILFPFKNRFCYLCNRANDIGLLYSDVKHIKVYELAYKFEDDGVTVFEYRTLLSLESFYYVSKLKDGNMKLNSPISLDVSLNVTTDTPSPDQHNVKNRIPYINLKAVASSIRNKAGKSVNIAKLVEFYYLHFGPQDFCDVWVIHGQRIGLKSNKTSCGCDIECIVRKDCCFDFAITTPVTNFQNTSLPVSKCMQKWYFDSPFKANCEDWHYGYLFNLPVRSKTSNLLYRNIFCFICNEYGYINSNEAFMTLLNSNSSKYNPLDLRIDCNFLLDIQKYFLMEDMISDLLLKSCNITIHVSDSVRFYGTISRCNETGVWSEYNSDIEWACETYFSEITQFKLEGQNRYKNLFCKMCNEEDSISKIQYIKCNMTGLQSFHDKRLEQACEFLPEIKTLGVYKNWFCFSCNPQPKSQDKCNNKYISYGAPMNSDNQRNYIMDTIVGATQRKIFSITTITNKRSTGSVMNDNHKDQKCGSGEMYDIMKEMCRTLLCIDGKILRNGQCVSLLEFTGNLGYIYITHLQGRIIVSEKKTVSQLVRNIKRYFPVLIANSLLISPTAINVVSTFFFTENECGRVLLANQPFEVSILVHASFYINTYVYRDKAEEALLNKTRENLNFTDNIVLKSSFDISAYLLPTKIHSFDHKWNCYKVKQKLFYNEKKYKLSLLSKLLTCKQVEIDSDQFTSTGDTHQISLLSSERVLNVGEFKITANGGAIICQDDFEDMAKKFRNSEDNRFKMILGVTSITFVSLSLLGLLVTFVTYCIFPRLQTLPGKNNMCLIFALFWAQCLLQFGLMQTSNPIVCSLLGILIHYFWLTTFCCMNVCSFHMFKLFVFVFKSLQDDSAHSKTFIRYVVYAYGTPAIIVIIHVITSVLVTNDNHIGYGGVTCFISTVPALIATFIAPVSLVCIVNAFLFSFAAYKLKSSPKMATNRTSQIDFQVYLKLFVLTGITWIFQIIESFFPPSYVSIVVAALNASQGIFVFLSYCVNKRVRNLYLGKFTSRELSTVTSTTKTSKIKSENENQV